MSREDQQFLRYVVDAPTNSYYRPDPSDYRPVPNRYRPQPEEPRIPPTTARPVPRTVRPRVRPETGYIDVRITLPRTRFAINDKVVIPCTINSYSRPNVVWKQNGRPLVSNQRVQASYGLHYAIPIDVIFI